jgi:hypothetical protein
MRNIQAEARLLNSSANPLQTAFLRQKFPLPAGSVNQV